MMMTRPRSRNPARAMLETHRAAGAMIWRGNASRLTGPPGTAALIGPGRGELLISRRRASAPVADLRRGAPGLTAGFRA
jgi:hypothetical protein